MFFGHVCSSQCTTKVLNEQIARAIESVAARQEQKIRFDKKLPFDCPDDSWENPDIKKFSYDLLNDSEIHYSWSQGTYDPSSIEMLMKHYFGTSGRINIQILARDLICHTKGLQDNGYGTIADALFDFMLHIIKNSLCIQYIQ